MQPRLAASLAASLALLASACSAKEPEQPQPPTPVQAPASQPGTPAAPIGRDDASHVVDPMIVPERAGVKRIFLRQGKTAGIRDPSFLKDGAHVIAVAKVSGVNGLWKVAVDGSAPATLILPTPLLDPNGPRNARNRPNWYIGTPRPFPDGTHVIFEGASPNPFEQFSNTMGIVPMEGGIVKAAVASGVKLLRTPDVHPDGETVMFASCDELRIGKLKGREDQEFETTRVLQIPKVPNAAATVCTVHRPRFSPDGKQIVFEGIGKFMSDEFKKQYGVPAPVNAGDYVMEIWIASTDGSGLHRVVTDEAYQMIAGRPQTGGSRDPVFSPDGTRIAFSHGGSIAVVTTDGKQARLVARHTVATKDGPAALTFDEDDPTFSPDGKTIVSASKLSDKDLAPPGLSVIDLAKIDATPAAPEPPPAPSTGPPTAPHPE